MEQADVIIIGGGPAGIAAAITCAQGGVRPLLVTERPQQLPANYDAAAEPLQSLHPGVQSLLKQLQVPDAIAHASRGTYTGIKVGETNTALSTVPGEIWTGSHIAPTLFAAYCLQMAQQLGVNVLFDSKVTDIVVEDGKVCGIILADGRQLKAGYLIDASGHKRFAGRYLNFEEQLHSPRLVCRTGNSFIPEDDRRDKQVAIFTPNKHGWTWEAFSAYDYYTWTMLAVKNSGTESGDETPGSQKPGGMRGGDMQWRVFRPVVCPGLLLVGDAAGILDPAAGQGILNGLLSGIMGAETVIKCVRQPQAANWYLTQYDTWYIGLFNKKAEMLKKKYGELGILIG
jgi:flavin-dependent dehydrogenase